MLFLSMVGLLVLTLLTWALVLIWGAAIVVGFVPLLGLIFRIIFLVFECLSLWLSLRNSGCAAEDKGELYKYELELIFLPIRRNFFRVLTCVLVAAIAIGLMYLMRENLPGQYRQGIAGILFESLLGKLIMLGTFYLIIYFCITIDDRWFFVDSNYDIRLRQAIVRIRNQDRS